MASQPVPHPLGHLVIPLRQQAGTGPLSRHGEARAFVLGSHTTVEGGTLRVAAWDEASVPPSPLECNTL